MVGLVKLNQGPLASWGLPFIVNIPSMLSVYPSASSPLVHRQDQAASPQAGPLCSRLILLKCNTVELVRDLLYQTFKIVGHKHGT